MLHVYCNGELLDVGAGTLGEEVARLREYWNEDPDEPQCFQVQDDGGQVLAVLLRDQSDGEVCHTLYADGTAEHHRCRYVLDGRGRYARTEATELAMV